MFDHRAPARSLAHVAITGALALMLMSGCGSDDDATQSQSVATAAAATSPSTAAAPAPAAAAPASKPSAKDCPVTASEVSKRLGVKLHSVRPFLNSKVSCAFGTKAACPCGSTKYGEATVLIAAPLPSSISKQRAIYAKTARRTLTDRPDLGKDAFLVTVKGQRGRSAIFPSSDGPAFVDVALGVRDASNRAHAAQDARAANRVISLVVKRMS